MSPKRNSGQILLIAAFIMASLLLSAQLYILEVGKITSEAELDSLGNFVLASRFGSKHVVIGSLANISNGGQSSVLGLSLERWSSFIGKQYQFGKSVLNYTLREQAPYSSGIWIDWSTSGIGISSAYADFTYKLSGQEVDLDQSYFINITTTVFVESSYQTVSGDVKEVKVTINLFNEAESVLAKQITVYYRLLGSWQIPDATNNYVILDYGNGTYIASFVANIPSQNVEVSAHTVDQRGIHVQANATSTEI